MGNQPLEFGPSIEQPFSVGGLCQSRIIFKWHFFSSATGHGLRGKRRVRCFPLFLFFLLFYGKNKMQNMDPALGSDTCKRDQMRIASVDLLLLPCVLCFVAPGSFLAFLLFAPTSSGYMSQVQAKYLGVWSGAVLPKFSCFPVWLRAPPFLLPLLRSCTWWFPAIRLLRFYVLPKVKNFSQWIRGQPTVVVLLREPKAHASSPREWLSVRC